MQGKPNSSMAWASRSRVSKGGSQSSGAHQESSLVLCLAFLSVGRSLAALHAAGEVDLGEISVGERTVLRHCFHDRARIANALRLIFPND